MDCLEVVMAANAIQELPYLLDTTPYSKEDAIFPNWYR